MLDITRYYDLHNKVLAKKRSINSDSTSEQLYSKGSEMIRYDTNIILLMCLTLFAQSGQAYTGFSEDYTELHIPFKGMEGPVSELIDEQQQIIEVVENSTTRKLKQVTPTVESNYSPDIEPFISIKIGDRHPFELGKGQRLFVRDPATLAWSANESTLMAVREGETEIYITSGDTLRIIPVRVESDMLDLDPLVFETKNNLPPISKKNLLGKMRSNYESRVGVGEGLKASNDSDIRDEVKKSQQKNFYKSVAIQVIESGSQPEKSRLLPISGINVEVVGGQYKAITNSKGIVEIPTVPAGSRFNIRITDPIGRVLQQIVEIGTSGDEVDEIFKVKLMSYDSYYLYSELLSVSQRSNQSSMCLKLMSDDGATPLSDLSVQINREADGPFYFNEIAPDMLLDRTTENGKVCFFNIDPGLVELNVLADGEYFTSTAIPLFEGHHLEDEVFIANSSELRMKIVSLPGANQLIYGEGQEGSIYYPVDYTDIISVGSNEDLEYLSPGLMQLEAGQTYYRGRIFSLVQGAEFETSLYSIDPNKNIQGERHIQVSPLIQRGFIEDLFNELYLNSDTDSIAFDSSLGSLYVRHGGRQGEDEESVSFKLVDHLGKVVQQPWYIGNSNDGFVNAVYFNLSPGVYTLVAQTKEGHWLDSTTVPVDYGMTSMVGTGAELTTNHSGNENI